MASRPGSGLATRFGEASRSLLESVEARVGLAELFDARARRLLEATSRDLGLEVHLLDADRSVLVGQDLSPEVVDAAGPMLASSAVADCGCDAPAESIRYLTRQIIHAGDVLGVLALGPYPAGEEALVAGAARHVAALADHLVDTGLEKLLASRMHVASIESAYEELQQKNQRLASAVDRLQELDKVKSNFLATVSHELRTPLTSVIGYSEMLYEGLAGPLNEEQSDYVKTVMEKGDQLLQIITGILDISRIEAGGLTLSRCAFPIDAVVDMAVTTMTPTLRRKGIRLHRRVDAPLPHVLADRDKVRQVIVNLLGNALKFTPDGGDVSVVVEMAPLRRLPMGGDPEANHAVRIGVYDSGIGIPREAMGRIFEPFYQVDSSSTRQFGGTGLGLAIVKSFVHAHGGSVWCESCPGQGSRFFVTLPVASSSA